ncbi:MAG: hypothetical protein QXE91_01355 [Thermofilaceae archaeon]
MIEAQVTFTVMAAAFTALVLTPLTARVMKKLGHLRTDVHKREQPKVPYSGGAALFASVIPFLIAFALLQWGSTVRVCVLLASSSTAFLLGLIDDFKVLGGKVKMLLSLLTAVPLAAAYILWPDVVQLGRPLVPLLGRLRLTIIYWLLLPLVAAGPANVVNMLDVFNGVMPATTFLTATTMAFASLVVGNVEGVVLLAPLIGALLGYLPYNKWPARILNGDSGSLFVGAYIGAVAALIHLEFIAAIALIPHILNGALVIISVGGFKEHREMKGRPVKILPDYRLAASSDLEAPISLTRLILAIDGPLDERAIVRRLIALSAVSCALAAFSSLLIPR